MKFMKGTVSKCDSRISLHQTAYAKFYVATKTMLANQKLEKHPNQEVNLVDWIVSRDDYLSLYAETLNDATRKYLRNIECKEQHQLYARANGELI